MNCIRFQSVRLILMIVLGMLGPMTASGDVTTVTLKSTVRVWSGDPIRLGQISTILGDQASALDELVIDGLLSGTRGAWQELRVDDLRGLFEETAGVHAGSVLIHGSGVSLRQVEAKPGVVSDTHRIVSSEPVVKDEGPVVRGHIERWVQDRYQIGNDQVRITFRDIDAEFLGTPTQGRLVEIREISKRGRTAIRVILMTEFEIVSEQALIFDVQIQRKVLIARKRLNRGAILDGSHFMNEQRWIDPDEPTATIAEALGMAITKTIKPGQLLLEQHIEKPMVIRRGDIVSAKSISGSVVVTVRGRATANARQGEIVEIESMNGESSFTARAIGKGRALIIKDSERNGA